MPAVNITPDMISPSLASDLAAGLSDLPTILERYQLTKHKLAAIVRHPDFKILFKEAKDRWNSDVNAQERVRSKSIMMVEESLLAVFGVIHDKEATPNNKIEGFKQLVGVADLGPKRDTGGGTGERVTIQINVPAMSGREPKNITLAGSVVKSESADASDE